MKFVLSVFETVLLMMMQLLVKMPDLICLLNGQSDINL